MARLRPAQLLVASVLLLLAIVIVQVCSVEPGYAVILDPLNVKVTASDGSTHLVGAVVTLHNATGDFPITVTCGGSGCWANYTDLIEGDTVTLKVRWEGSYVNGTFSHEITGPENLLIATKVYVITPVWKSSSGGGLYVDPAAFKWTPANGTLSGNLTAAKAYLVQNGTVTISAVVWEGSLVTPGAGTSFNPALGNPTIDLAVYLITPKWYDNAGSGLYVQPTDYHLTFTNGTTRDVVPGVSYWLQNGTTTISFVIWEGTDVTPVAATFYPADGSPSFNLKIYGLTLAFRDDGATVLSPIITSYTIQFPNSTSFTGRTATSYRAGTDWSHHLDFGYLGGH